MKFTNKTAFRLDVIRTYYERGKNLTKTELANKMSVSRKTLYKLLNQYSLNNTLNPYKRSYSNNKVEDKTINNVTKEFELRIRKLNKNRNETIYMPTFKMAYNFSEYSLEVSLRTYQNILKSNNIYVPSCKRKTKKDIRRRIKLSKNKQQIINMDLVNDLDDLKAKRIYKGKKGHFGLSVEFDACEHAWIKDEKFHIYKAVDSFTGKIIAMHAEKEETGKGYLSILRQMLTKYGKPHLIITDKRKCFWNGIEANSHVARIIKDLDIEIFSSSDPTSKPNVERSFRNSQQLFPMLFHTLKINSIESVNHDKSLIINEYNQYYEKNKSINESSFVNCPILEIEEKLNFEIQRKVTKGNFVSISGKKYAPFNKTNQRIIMEDDAKIKIYSSDINNLFVLANSQKIFLKELSDEEIIKPITAEYKRIEFEKRKQISFNNMIDDKLMKLDEKERVINTLLNKLRKEKETLVSSI